MRPYLQCPQHRILHGLLGQLEMSRSEKPCQVREDAARLMPEQMFQYRSGLFAASTGAAHIA
jgi:hypothetical protein